MLVSVDQIEQAHESLQSVVSKTPLQHDRFLSEKYQATVLLKREDLQKVRSFKLRGAYYAIAQQDPAILKRGGCLCKCRQSCPRGRLYLS